jgi:hypothetical protein
LNDGTLREQEGAAQGKLGVFAQRSEKVQSTITPPKRVGFDRDFSQFPNDFGYIDRLWLFTELIALV